MQYLKVWEDVGWYNPANGHVCLAQSAMNNQPTQRIMVLLPGRSATDCQQLQVYMEGAGLQFHQMPDNSVPSKSSWSSCVPRYMQSSRLIIDKRGSVYFRCNAHVGHPSEALQLPPKKFEELLSKCQDEMNATRIARSAATGVGESEDFTFYIFSTHECSSICQFLPSNDINWN